jgi:D-amino-acid dehydrogenase
MSSHRRVVIVGGGVIGLSAAYHCARRGFRVTLVERHSEARDGCSFGNAGMICPSHFVPLAAPGMVALGLKWMWNPRSPFYIKPRLDLDLLRWGFAFWRAANPGHVRRSAPLLRDLSLASRTAFEEFAALPGVDFGLVRKGLLMLCRSNHALDEEAAMAARARDLGIPAEVLDAKQTAELDPGATMDIVGSVYFPKDCHLVPDRFVGALQREAVKLGATFLWDTDVRGWRMGGGRIEALQTSRGDLDADDYVLCGGSWSPEVARGLGLRLPMQAGKGYSLTLPNPRQLPAICSILTEARVAVTPMAGALRFGGTMEMAGLNEDINPLRIQGIVDAASRYYPAFRAEDFAGIQPWRGLRPVSPDGLPYLGRSRSRPNLIVATGHAMLGLSLAPISGRIVAALAAGERPPIDVGLLDPERYG